MGRIVAKVRRIGPGLVAEANALLVVLPAVGNVVHGELHVLVADPGAEVLVEDASEAARVEDGEGGVEVDEAALLVAVERGHGKGRRFVR